MVRISPKKRLVQIIARRWEDESSAWKSEADRFRNFYHDEKAAKDCERVSELIHQASIRLHARTM